MPDDSPAEDRPDPSQGDITHIGDQPAPGGGAETTSGAEPAPGDETTPGGYSYTVVDDTDAPAEPASSPARRAGVSISPIFLTIVAIVPAIIVGALVWFLVGGGGGGSDSRTQGDVGNVVSAFSQGSDGAVSTRYEGEVPPGMPDIPTYAGAEVVSALVQVQGDDASYLVIYDTSDSREDVTKFYADALSKDPWQIDAGSDSRDSTFAQFSKIDDADVSGLVLVSASKDGDLTTIVHSAQVVSGASDTPKTPFVQGEPRTLPEGFPENVPIYDGGLIIQAAYQKQAGAAQYAVSFVTKDSITDVLDFYRDKLGAASLTVEDGDASQATLEDAEVITFTDASGNLRGVVTAGKFGDDTSYTRVDLQVQVTE